MKDNETAEKQTSIEEKTETAALQQDNSVIPSERLQNQFIQRGRLDIHHHQIAIKHLKLGADALNARNYEKAIEEFLTVIQHNRESAEAHFHLGLAYFMLENYEKAIDAYKMAMTCEPGEAAVYINLAATYRMLKRYDEAIQVYERAVQIIPNNHELHTELGAVYALQGKRREAIAAYKNAMLLKLKPPTEHRRKKKEITEEE